jgi:hypothetical protein
LPQRGDIDSLDPTVVCEEPAVAGLKAIASNSIISITRHESEEESCGVVRVK